MQEQDQEMQEQDQEMQEQEQEMQEQVTNWGTDALRSSTRLYIYYQEGNRFGKTVNKTTTNK